MFNLEQLEAAGFAKTMTTEEWEEWSKKEAARYERPDPNGVGTVAAGKVVKDYVLKRGNVLIITEQNTQDSAPMGVRTIVEYPQIVVVMSEDGQRSVTCNADDTDLILTLAEEVALPPGRRRR